MWQAAADAKDSLGLLDDWKTYEDYNRNKQNEISEEDQPGSVTNVIFPIIASQVADLVDEPTQISCIGEEPSDQFFATDLEHILDYFYYQNRMFFKIDRHEWRRLKFGTGGWKVYFDPIRKMVVFEPTSPVNIFPDPKIKEPWHLDEGDFFAHALYQPIPFLRRLYGSPANSLKPQKSSSDGYNLNIFDGEDADETRETLSNKARVIEMWTKEAGGILRRRVVGNDNVVLFDSKKDNNTSFYEHGKYPFIITPCYPIEGQVWGMGDSELLLPTQDLINDLDDQVRLNARLMGNIQVVVGIASGINIKKWTAKAGLKIPARDPNAWKMVQPPQIPHYILERRAQALQEAEIIAGRPDIVEGRRSGVRAASAIMALQEAGNRRARHKKMGLQESLTDALYFSVDYLKEFFTEEQAFRILGRSIEAQTGEPQYLWFKGSKLKQIPRLIPNTLKKGELKYLLDANNEQMTKDAKFDIRLNIGAGLPHNKAFLYNALLDMVKEGIVTREEARIFLKDTLDWPIANVSQPIGNNFGMGPVMPGGRPMMPGMSGAVPPPFPPAGMAPGGQMVPSDDGEGIPPEILNSLLAAGAGQGGVI